MKILRTIWEVFLAPTEMYLGILRIRKKQRSLASKLGFTKVSEEKGAVAKKIRNFVVGGFILLCSYRQF
jgi:hypothetical protein